MSTPDPDVQPSPLDILSPRTVHATVNLDEATVWRMRRRGEFPEPVRLSPGRVGYLRKEIEAWIASRARATR